MDNPGRWKSQQYDYVECDKCKKSTARKSRREPRTFNGASFTLKTWACTSGRGLAGLPNQRSIYRDEMIKVFGGRAGGASPLLHGKKGNAWIHVGRSTALSSSGQVWSIPRGAAHDLQAVTILSADFDTLSGSEKSDISERTAVAVTVRVIPSQPIEVRRRMGCSTDHRTRPSNPWPCRRSTLHCPLSWRQGLGPHGESEAGALRVDIVSFLASQRPVFKAPSDNMSRERARRPRPKRPSGTSGKRCCRSGWPRPIPGRASSTSGPWTGTISRAPARTASPSSETDWQSFRVRQGKGGSDPLVFTAEFKYAAAWQVLVAARVTDVFGNDGIATSRSR